jgi:3-oxoacyl-[acyl-carrier protein] reductase
MLLQDRIAIVTGAAQGLGLAIASRYLEQGATVVLADLDGGAADAAATALEDDRAHGAACDVTDEEQVQRLFDDTAARHGRIDVLVNNAGITRDAVAHRMTLEQFRQVVDVHLQGTWLGTRAALTHMRGREGAGRS